MVILRTRKPEDFSKVKNLFAARDIIEQPESNVLLFRENDADYSIRAGVTALTCENPGLQVISEVFNNGTVERVRIRNGEYTQLNGMEISWAPDTDAQDNKKTPVPVCEAPAAEIEALKLEPAITEAPADEQTKDEADAGTPEKTEAVPAPEAEKEENASAEEDAAADESGEAPVEEAPEELHEKEEKTASDKKDSVTDKKDDKGKPVKITQVEKGTHKVPPLRPVPETSYTLADAAAKLDAAVAEIPSNMGDTLWTIERLKKMCETDNDLIQYIMLEDKSFMGGFQYLYELLRNKDVDEENIININSKSGRDFGGEVSKENALKYFVEYFKLDEEEKTRLEDEKKKAEAEKRKAEAAAKKAKTSTKKAAKKSEAKAKDVKQPEAAKPDVTKQTNAAKPAVAVEQKPAKKQSGNENQLSFFDLFAG